MSIIVPDIRITVSFSHQISNHTQMTIPAVFEKQTLAVQHTVFTTLTCMSTELHTQAVPGRKTLAFTECA